jgi:hypothetical protein
MSQKKESTISIPEKQRNDLQYEEIIAEICDTWTKLFACRTRCLTKHEIPFCPRRFI